MTDSQQRHLVLDEIEEARKAGVSLELISDFLDISVRTLQRWQQNQQGDLRKGSRRRTQNKLTDSEKEAILETVNSPEYRGLAPAEIVAILAEKGLYLASERTIYRVLKKHAQLVHRGPGRKPVKRERPVHEVNKPLQLLSWDITYLRSSINGIFFYLYLVMDVWSRKIVT